MRIDDNQGAGINQTTDSVHSVAPRSSSPSPERVQQGDPQDGAVLSSDAQKLSRLSTALAKLPAIRQGRVDQLRESIQNNTFSPSSRDIAQALVNDLSATKGVK